MTFSIGYQLPTEMDSTVAIARDFPGQVTEVYFAPPGEPSGRSPLETGMADILMQDLTQLADMNVRITMLLNASCYGAEATSLVLRDRVRAFLDAYPMVQGVTVCSPAVARFVKEYRPEVQVCASVNMRVGSIAAMRQLAQHFDAYYMKRELNRNFTAIEQLSSWCRENGKELRLLANSGCLYDCAFQTFHDNLVSHETEALKMPSASTGRAAPCRDYLATTDAAAEFLRATWIRPEDIRKYEPWFSSAKLATRMHMFPRKVVNAYVRGRYRGNLLDLTEPSLSSFLRGTVLDATRMPEDWFTVTTSCSRNCESCGYCARVSKEIALSMSRLESTL